MEKMGLYLLPPKMRGDAANFTPDTAVLPDFKKSFIQMSYSELKDFLKEEDKHSKDMRKWRSRTKS